jgi:hypothetical protein
MDITGYKKRFDWDYNKPFDNPGLRCKSVFNDVFLPTDKKLKSGNVYRPTSLPKRKNEEVFPACRTNVLALTYL